MINERRICRENHFLVRYDPSLCSNRLTMKSTGNLAVGNELTAWRKYLGQKLDARRRGMSAAHRLTSQKRRALAREAACHEIIDSF